MKVFLVGVSHVAPHGFEIFRAKLTFRVFTNTGVTILLLFSREDSFAKDTLDDVVRWVVVEMDVHLQVQASHFLGTFAAVTALFSMLLRRRPSPRFCSCMFDRDVLIQGSFRRKI